MVLLQYLQKVTLTVRKRPLKLVSNTQQQQQQQKALLDLGFTPGYNFWLGSDPEGEMEEKMVKP